MPPDDPGGGEIGSKLVKCLALMLLGRVRMEITLSVSVIFRPGCFILLFALWIAENDFRVEAAKFAARRMLTE